MRGRQFMDMDVRRRVGFENSTGFDFFRPSPCPHPQEQPALVHLRLKIIGMVFAHQIGQRRADHAAGSAAENSRDGGGQDRAGRGHHGPRSRHGSHVEKAADQPAFRIADRFG